MMRMSSRISVAMAALLAGGTLAHGQSFQQVAPAPQSGSFGVPLPPPPPAPPTAADMGVSPAAAPARKKRVAAPPPRFAALSKDTRPTFGPQSVVATDAAVSRYRAIVQQGGWPRVSAGSTAQIRQRLEIEGDLEPGGDQRAALRKFQMRHGLAESGVMNPATLAAMNITAETRLRQLEASVTRMRSSSFTFGDRYVVVNIPAAAVETIENGQIRRRYVAVVGKAERASPPVETRITNVNFNPTWTVPTSIIKKDIIPKMQKDPGYLSRSKIRILDGRGREINPSSIDWSTERAANFTLRQDPGAGNSLGQVRIDMPNNLAVYMHDTPSKRLFARDDRFHSSGCVRVADVRDLATWLLSGNSGWERSDTESAIASQERKDVRLARAVPVAWTYFTGYGMPDGTAHFRSDIYDLDRAGGGMPIAVRSAPRPDAPSLATGALEPEPQPPAQPGFWEWFRGQ
jgi:L,D-transpeptidase YcbB